MESRATCWRFFAPSRGICRTLYKQGNHLQWVLLFIFLGGVLSAGLPTEGLSHEAEITPRRMTDLGSLSVLEKMKLVDAYMRHTVFEVHVSRVPALLPLFKAFEKQTKHKFRGIKMSDFDESCQRYYEDSASMRGDFDRDFRENYFLEFPFFCFFPAWPTLSMMFFLFGGTYFLAWPPCFLGSFSIHSGASLPEVFMQLAIMWSDPKSSSVYKVTQVPSWPALPVLPTLCT
mmetsp:Transcript_7717/g.26562  ORF Transcript_7717/g.26562 Transcript_7717/m.26562 type:complete len:231 (-) Transcript_7717:1427-2119(-)